MFLVQPIIITNGSNHGSRHAILAALTLKEERKKKTRRGREREMNDHPPSSGSASFFISAGEKEG